MKKQVMVGYPYFNPFRPYHVALMQYLNQELVNDTDKIEMYKFGDRTQHIFRNGKYLMTVNWSKV